MKVDKNLFGLVLILVLFITLITLILKSTLIKITAPLLLFVVIIYISYLFYHAFTKGKK